MLTENKKKIILDLLKKGIEHHGTKNYHDAVKLYKKVLIIDNKNYDAIRHLGIANLDQGIYEKAEHFFKKAISIRSDLPEAYNNLATVFLKLRKYEKATEYYNACLKINSSYLPAINNVASMHNKLGQGDKAIKFASMAYAAQPDNILSIRNYAHAKILNGGAFEGITLLKKIADEHNEPESLNLLANCYRETGELKLSLECYHKVLQIDPTNPHAFYHLTESKKNDLTKTQIDKIIKKLEGKSFEGTYEDAVRCFGLYNFFDFNKNYKEAFTYLKKANQIVNKLLNPHLNNEKVYLKAIKKSLTKELIEKYEVYGSKSEKPIFIIGMPRSGTTLIEQILGSHSEVFGAGELPYIPHTIIAPSYNFNNEGEKRYETINNWISKDTISRWSDHYLKLISKIYDYDDSPRVTDKLPHNFIHLGMIKILFPKAKIIYCKRDAMDNCLSLLKTAFEQDHYYFYDQKLIALYYNLHLEFMDYWKNECEINMYTLNHEELINDPKNTISKVLNFCNLKWEDDCMMFHKSKRRVSTASATQVRQPINKKSIRAWEKYKDNLQLMIKTLQ